MSDEKPIPAHLAELRRQLASLESLRGVLGDALTDEKKAEVEGHIRTLVETHGGAVLVGDVTVGRDLIGRDRWEIILGDKHEYVGQPLHRVPPEVLTEAYLLSLAGQCSRLPLSVMDPQFVTFTGENPVPLQAVYIDLEVQAPVREERGKQAEHAFLARLARGEAGGERVSALEAIGHPQATRFVLLGDPGSGKSTFVNYLALALARSHLFPASDEARKLADWPGRHLFPLRIVLREFAARHLPAGAGRGTAAMIWKAIKDSLGAYLGEEAAGHLFPHLQERLLRQGGLLLLDGLDEVPETDRRRARVLEAVADFATPLRRSRLLVTARPYAYADPAWRLRGFETLLLAPFRDEQVERFIGRWYQAVAPYQGWDADTARTRGERLRAALRETPYLADLATRPMLLTLMATLHTAWGQLPEDRADLYDHTVRLLLGHWQKAKEVIGPDGQPQVEPGIVKALQVGEEAIEASLHRLAHAVHERQGKEPERGSGAADITEEELLAAFAPALPDDVHPRLLTHYVQTRAGLLLARAPGVYTFPHRSFQEYLAACHLAEGADFAEQLRDRVGDDAAWWREVFLFGVGKARRGGLGNAVHKVNVLVPENPDEVSRITETHWRAAVLGGQALVDLRLPEKAAGQPHFEAALRRLRRWLAALLETPQALTPRERAEAGDVLGKLGDTRPGVALSPLPVGEGLGVRAVPDIVWCQVPAGSFLMGSREDEEMAYGDERPQHTLTLPAFCVSRYPISNAQYGAFWAAGGYDEPRYWTEEGWGWRTGEREPDLSVIEDEDLRRNWEGWLAGRPVEKRDRPFWWDDPSWNLPNRPVVGVSWYEALAFCAWLTGEFQVSGFGLQVQRGMQLETLNLEPGTLTVRLPSEAEWEKAARGTDGRRWPWGDEWAEGRANTSETGLGTTSAVGCFPAGASPCEALDMAGNVWEWTRSKWGKRSGAPGYGYPYDPTDGREGLLGSDLRVVRGGSWDLTQGYARCAYRHRYIPVNFFDLLGFRLVVSLARSGF